MEKGKIYTIIRFIFGFMIAGSGAAMLFMGGAPVEYESEAANAFLKAFEDTNYFIPFLSIVKIACGVALLTNRFVPLALVIFIPVSVNMAFFHFFLEFISGVPAYLILAMNIYLLFKNVDVYKPMLKSNA
ncbi:DUF3185 domain-containing protein [Bacillus mesophilum]|uniref:DUF3185 domain-containing protein n=1 Tax=Bacillus mesophilum TaxID=1071718 RepID=A0A7V7RKE0_9BACI|nr:DUF3185 domain-containing protein [Bacillus mesophilum]KAB2331712.1 DUF3185 domain-containing protein [Bacillus mesophilum]